MKNSYRLKIVTLASIILVTVLLGCFNFYSNAVEENESDSNAGNNTGVEMPPPIYETPAESTETTNTEEETSEQNNTQTTTPTSSSTPNTRTSVRNETSSNANLSNLGIRPHDFTGFTPNTTSYSVTVPSDTEAVEVYAQAADNSATISGTGTVTLEEGENIINVTVTAEDGTTKTYTINITRETSEVAEENVQENGLAKLVIQNVEMTPEFKTNTYEYTAKYIGEKTTLPIEVEATDETYQIEIVGNEDLKEGENIITILVSESNGNNVATYQITVEKSLVDEEALAREQAEKEQRQRMIIGAIIAVVVIIAIIVFVIIRRRRNKKFAEEYSGVPFYGMNNDEEDFDNYDEYKEQPKALKKKRKFIEDDTYNEDEENDNNDEQDEMMDITKKFAEEDEEEKLRRQRVREKFLNGYNKNNYEEDDENQDEDYVETPRKRSKGKRYK